jgi:hypothetical protein
MFRPFPTNCAGLSAVLTGLLAVAALTLGAPQAQAQKSAAVINKPVNPGAGPATPSGMTPLAVLNGQAIRVGPLEPTQKLHLVLSIQVPHMPEEEQFIKELTTKGSPNFHKFLTAELWNARFAPSAEDEQAVVDWAKSQGLTVTQRYANRLLVEADGTVGTIEKAFGVTMNKYQVGDEVDFSNDRDPFIPSALTGILRNVLGLSNVERVHRAGASNSLVKGALPAPGPLTGHVHGDGDPTRAPANRAAARQAGALMANPTPSDSFPLNSGVANPDSIQSSEAYDYNALQRLSHCCNEWGDSSGSPPESSIALIGFGAFNVSDVETFFGNYGMAYDINWQCFSNGGSTCPGVDTEAPLDVEYAGAMANSYGSHLDTAHIYEYEMSDGYFSTYAAAFNKILSDNVAKVVSTSYGYEENVGFSGSVATGTMHPIFNSMVGQGFTLIASSGDNGASDGCGDATAVDYPSSDPDFLAAGGTQLQLNDSGIFQSEIGWQGESQSGACGSNHGGSTGGVSVLFAAPWWQTSSLSNSTYPNGVVSPFYLWKNGGEYVETGNSNRMVPDISLTANPDVMGEWYYSGGSWQDEGGTSIVAPELAGFFAQENSYLDYVGWICGSGSSPCSPVGNAAPFIYEDAIYGAQHNPFYDMTSGCSNNDITAAYSLFYYCAYTGYDPITGWGSANMLQLSWGINWELIPAYGNPSLSFSGPATNTWFNSDQVVSWTLSDSGGSLPAPGVAGFTQGWDSIPADPYSEPHGGSGNSFYSGPQYPFARSGCLSFNGLYGCSGGSGQGCHTAHVEGWDNQGHTAFGTYGPLCYDTVAPTISVSTNPVTSGTIWVNKSVVVTLTPTDPGGSNASGIYKTYYAVNAASCYPGNIGSCSVYSSPFTISTPGQTYVYYWTQDNAGNVSTEPYQWISIDETAPVTTGSLSGTVYSGSTYKTAVQVTLSASDTGGSGVANTYYQLDGGSTITYPGSAFTVSALGGHSVKYWSTDAAGNVETAKTVAFSISSPTTALLGATPNPSLLGQSVMMTATLTATLSGTPTGSVTFYNGATNLGSGTLSGGVATLSTTALPAGALTLQASYPGAGNFLPTNSAPFDQTVDMAAAITSPAPGSTLTGTSATFSWTAGVGVKMYELRLGTTGPGSSDVYNVSGTTTTALTSPLITNIPAYGVTLYARLYSWINGGWQHNDYTYTESGSPVLAVLTTPAPGSTLSGTSATFSWTAGGGVTKYQFRLGTTGPGSNNVYNAADATTTALTSPLITIPAYGVTLYARLYSMINGAWQFNDYTYMESGTPVLAVLLSPTPGSRLTGSSATFSWSAGGGVTKYEFRLGTTGPGSNDVYNSAETTTTALTTGVVSNIPLNGATLYARLYSWINGAWQHNDYTYTETLPPAPAVLTSPTPGTTLTGTSATFTWTAGGSVAYYEFRLGTTGPGSNNVYNAANATTTALTSPLITIPTYGVTLYARLYSWINGAWQYNDYTYMESGTPVKAVLTSPTPGSTLTGSSATFNWTAGGGVTKYEFRLGTTGPGSNNVYNSANATTTALTTGVVSNIPTTGGTIYARLYSWINGAWQYNDYTYTEQ